MTEKRFNWDWKTGRWKDTQSDWLAIKNPRTLETIINDACIGYEKEIDKLKKENEQLKERNKRQYNQLKELWDLIEGENWEILIEMVNQMKEEDERLQRMGV